MGYELEGKTKIGARFAMNAVNLPFLGSARQSSWRTYTCV